MPMMPVFPTRETIGTNYFDIDMTHEEGLAVAQAQLRHKSEMTTMKYDQAPVEDRRDALDRLE